MQVNFATYRSAQAITPSDTTLVNCRALVIGVGGTLSLSIDSTTAAVQMTLATGTILPFELNGGRVMSTGTAATTITALS